MANPSEIAKHALSSHPEGHAPCHVPSDEPACIEHPKADYARTLESGLAMDAGDNLDEALFRFAINLVHTVPDPEFMAMGHRFVPHWRRHMESEAFAIVVREIKSRLEAM